MPSPMSNPTVRRAARDAAMRRISAQEEERTPERVEEELDAARKRVKELERELETSRQKELPEEERTEARLSPARIYSRLNARKRPTAPAGR